MEIIIQPTPEAATKIAARIIARLLREKPDAVLGLATGSTPLLLYRELAAMKLDWHRVTTFNLDEYVGLPREHPQYRILILLNEAIRRDAHFIAQNIEDYPQAMFQCLWNSCRAIARCWVTCDSCVMAI